MNNIRIEVPDAERYAIAAGYIARYYRTYADRVTPAPIVVREIVRDTSRRFTCPKTSARYEDGAFVIDALSEAFALQAFDRIAAEYPQGTAPHGMLFEQVGCDWGEAPEYMTVGDKIVRAAVKLQCLLETDYADGVFFSYQHLGYKPTIGEAQASGARVTNCVVLMNWVLKEAGVYADGEFNHLYNGTVGYTCSTDECREAMTGGAFEIIETDKTIRELGEADSLVPGDIIFFLDYHADHNQIVLDNTHAIDGGRGNCYVVEVGAPFRRFIGVNRCMDARVGLIFRAKANESELGSADEIGKR